MSPDADIKVRLGEMVPPQVRGCPPFLNPTHVVGVGSPAGAGMSRPNADLHGRHGGFPRRCGDVPQFLLTRHSDHPVPPQVRGCPRLGQAIPHRVPGSPAGAGMSRPGLSGGQDCRGFPRRCGDVPVEVRAAGVAAAVPPQVRGCPLFFGLVERPGSGSPAGAGMSLPGASPPAARGGFPRRCGDVPEPTMALCGVIQVPPQVRGCPPDLLLNLGSPGRFPRRCGDVPINDVLPERVQQVPPQVRGCPWSRSFPTRRHEGSPAGAGMSLYLQNFRRYWRGFPRRCGDVPIPSTRSASSLRVPPQVR